jgi:hypothetical protein
MLCFFSYLILLALLLNLPDNYQKTSSIQYRSSLVVINGPGGGFEPTTTSASFLILLTYLFPFKGIDFVHQVSLITLQ